MSGAALRMGEADQRESASWSVNGAVWPTESRPAQRRHDSPTSGARSSGAGSRTSNVLRAASSRRRRSSRSGVIGSLNQPSTNPSGRGYPSEQHHGGLHGDHKGEPMTYPNPGTPESPVQFKDRYDNFIGGKWVPPIQGRYFENISPVTGHRYCDVARSDADDIELALDAGHAAREAWGKTSPAERSNILLRIADRIEENLEYLAVVECWENGKAVRETLAADMPLVVDHFRYFAGVLRGQEGSISQIDEDNVAYHF